MHSLSAENIQLPWRTAAYLTGFPPGLASMADVLRKAVRSLQLTQTEVRGHALLFIFSLVSALSSPDKHPSHICTRLPQRETLHGVFLSLLDETRVATSGKLDN